VLRSLEAYEEAVPHYRRAREVDPRNSDVLNNLGLTLCEIGELQEGIAVLEEARALEPFDAMVCRNLGEAHFKLKNLPLATQYFELAYLFDPTDKEALETAQRLRADLS
jgi:Tfp pilus assembly protein PilF